MKKFTAVLLIVLFTLAFASVSFAAEGAMESAVGAAVNDEVVTEKPYIQADATSDVLPAYSQNASTNSSLLSITSPAEGSKLNISTNIIYITINVNGTSLDGGKLTVCIVQNSTGRTMEVLTTRGLYRGMSPVDTSWYPSYLLSPVYAPGSYSIVAVATNASGAQVCKATSAVTLFQPAKNIYLPQGSLRLAKGSKVTVKPFVYPETASNKKVTWKSSNKKVATVSAKGVIVAKKPGTAKITAKNSGGQSVTLYVTVVASKVRVTKLGIANLRQSSKAVKSTSIKVGDEVTLAAWITPASATNNLLTWKSKNPGIAKINSVGHLTGIRRGKATIVCTVAGKTAKLTVTVK